VAHPSHFLLRSGNPKVGEGVNMGKRIGFLLVLAAVSAGPLLMAQIGYSQRAKQIGTKLKCMCRGCDMSAGLCAHPGGSFSGPCDTAKAELKEIDEHLAKGDSEQQIIDAFVAEYGTTVYVEPPKKGFGLVAWLMPVFYSCVGLGILVVVVRKWAVKPAPATPGAPANVPNEALQRAKEQAARETED
jgi:cytochrome c-type biogenesis protein CcmH